MYNIAIPSHNRSATIGSHILSFLERHNIERKIIYIFVDESELGNYKHYEKMGYNICIGGKGISTQRMAISDYFPENDFIVSMDDDLKEMYLLDEPILDLNLFILYCILKLQTLGLTLAGVYPTNNSYFFKHTETTDLRFLIGQFKIFRNKRFIERRKYVLLEDYENTIKHYDYAGGVLRLNYIGLKANYLTMKGGLYNYRNKTLKATEVVKFNEEYPTYSRIKKTHLDICLKKNAIPERVTTLWIGPQGMALNRIAEMCLMSWIRQGYNIDLYVDKKIFKLPEVFALFEGRITLLDANEIMDISVAGDKSVLLPLTDLWRYKMLYKKGGTWLDADMFLLSKLPQDKIIISSENTMQSGAFKSFQPIVPNIGVLRFPKEDPFLKSLIDKIEKRTKVAVFCDNMKIFRKEIIKTDYPIMPPEMFCPVDWWNYKDIYYSEIYKEKFNVEPISNSDILTKSVAVHLWNNFTFGGGNRTAIDWNTINPNSLYSTLFTRL